MRVLFLSSAGGVDYQCDLLFHGLRRLLGEDAVDFHYLWYLYDIDLTSRLRRSLYGKGFTVCGHLPEIKVDRTDIEGKIQKRYFDLVVYGSVWRYRAYLPLVLSHYDGSQIAFVDGEDEPKIITPLLSRGRYFKRECTRDSAQCIPINFAIPREAIRPSIPEKTQLSATVVPGYRDTYVFEDEAPYYDDYARSIFGPTSRKAGWDCMRHYEILANGCIPLFPDLVACPSHTMISFPKKFVRRANVKYPPDITKIPPEIYEACRDFTLEYLNTEVLATDFLDAMRNGKRRLPRTHLALPE
jgi:hypothetical protein